MAWIRHPKDFWSGVLFVAVGLSAIVLAAKYNLGTAARMGPGYFPRILGLLLVVLGAVIALRGLRLQGPAIPRWHWRPTILVLGSVVLFGGVVESFGVALATVLLILVASSASHEFRPVEALIAGVLLAGLAVGVFVVGLKLSLPIWPEKLGPLLLALSLAVAIASVEIRGARKIGGWIAIGLLCLSLAAFFTSMELHLPRWLGGR